MSKASQHGDSSPAIPPRPDVSYVGATRPVPPERTHSCASTSSQGSIYRREPPPIPPPPQAMDADWETKEEMRQRELQVLNSCSLCCVKFSLGYFGSWLCHRSHSEIMVYMYMYLKMFLVFSI